MHVFAGKNNKKADFPAYNAGLIGEKNEDDSTYHVTLKDGKLDASKSDYITLVEVAKDLASEANIKDALDKISERTVTINGQSQALISKIDESYFVNNIVIKGKEINLVTELYDQYSKGFDAAWNKIVSEMKNEFDVDVSAYKEKAQPIYDACNPRNFVDKTTFEISSPTDCETNAAIVINAIEDLRRDYVNNNTGTAENDAFEFLSKVVEKITGLESALDSETRGKIAELAAINQDFNGNKAGATLYDVISQTGTAKFEVEGSAFSDYVGKVLDKLGISGDDKKDLEAEIKDILNGSFVSLEITVAECDQSNQSQVH